MKGLIVDFKQDGKLRRVFIPQSIALTFSRQDISIAAKEYLRTRPGKIVFQSVSGGDCRVDFPTDCITDMSNRRTHKRFIAYLEERNGEYEYRITFLATVKVGRTSDITQRNADRAVLALCKNWYGTDKRAIYLEDNTKSTFFFHGGEVCVTPGTCSPISEDVYQELLKTHLNDLTIEQC